MPKKRNVEPLPNDIQIVKFEPGEFRPLFVKASDIGEVVIGLSPKTLANWRSQGIGPVYTIINGQVYYRLSILEEYFSRCPVKTIDEK
jgi:hypothetical protein